MLPKEYRTISGLSGPLMMVENTSGVRYDELVEIELGNGEKRRGRVLEIESTRALVQVFEGTSGIDIADTKVRFIGKVLTLPVSRDMLGARLQRARRPHRRRRSPDRREEAGHQRNADEIGRAHI